MLLIMSKIQVNKNYTFRNICYFSESTKGDKRKMSDLANNGRTSKL